METMISPVAGLVFALQAGAAESAPCTRREAVRASVAEIARRPERFFDRCVTVSGPFAGISMYSGREGMYLIYRFGRDGNFLPANRMHRIGIDNQQMRDLRLRYPQQTTVTGRVDSCERRSQRIIAAGGIPFLGGYCHYHDGPTVVVHSYNITERQFERVMGEDARRRLGNLVLMPADRRGRDIIEAAASTFLQALRTGDRAQLMRLHEIRGEDERARSFLYRLLESPHSVFRQVRERPSVQTAFFVSADEHGTPLRLKNRSRPPRFAFAGQTIAPTDGRFPGTTPTTKNIVPMPARSSQFSSAVVA